MTAPGRYSRRSEESPAPPASPSPRVRGRRTGAEVVCWLMKLVVRLSVEEEVQCQVRDQSRVNSHLPAPDGGDEERDQQEQKAYVEQPDLVAKGSHNRGEQDGRRCGGQN